MSIASVFVGIGSILVGVAVILVVGAYLARPFRVVRVAEGADLDRDIEAWVSQVRAESPIIGAVEADLEPATGAAEVYLESVIDGAEADPEPVNFCSRCGRRLNADDRFCPGCGTQIERGGAQ